MSNLVDLSHRISNGLTTYPGLPPPLIDAYIDHQNSQSHYTNGTEFHIGQIRLVMNTGTYVDSPFHRYREGTDISGLALDQLANLDSVCIRTKGHCLDRSALEGADIAGKAVLIHTGWSRHWGTDEYFCAHPFVTADAARYLVEAGVLHVGIDSLNIDDIADGRRPVHSELLAANIPITEHLTNLGALPDCNYRYFAVPVKVAGAGSFPVRAFACIP